ncbi:MAG: phosphatase PAP2 family protein [Planctomycetes bacterium]|nr:phosphatase PAP2 family protein [Planctomycetota bacterium]
MFGNIDRSILYFFNRDLANPVFDVLFFGITKSRFLDIAGIVLIVGLALKGGRKGRLVALLAVGCVAFTDMTISYILKGAFCRPRPCYVLSDLRMLISRGGHYGFPSNHAANMFALASVVSFFYRKMTAPCFVFASLVGFSRIYIGKHYPSDVLAGAVYGVMAAGLFVWAGSAWLRHFPGDTLPAAQAVDDSKGA